MPWLKEIVITLVVGAAAMLVLPLIFDSFTLTRLVAYGILALSLGFIWGYGGILCFGQAAFFGLGAYAFAIAAINTDAPWFAFLMAMIVPAIAAAILGAMMFYGRLTDVYMAVITLVFTLILFKFMNTTAGQGYKIGTARLGGYNGIPGFPTLTKPWNPGDYLYGESLYYFSFILLILVYAILRAILRSKFGRVLVGIRENELRAELVGYDVRLIKTAAFAIGGAIAGLAGCIFANWAEIITPQLFSLGQSSEIIIWVITGGAGTLIGPVIGAGVLGLIKSFLGETQAAFTIAGNRIVIDNFFIMGVILILAVLFLPRGIFPALQSLWKRLTNSGRPSQPRPKRRPRDAA